jgi:hypothetical protein
LFCVFAEYVSKHPVYFTETGGFCHVRCKKALFFSIARFASLILLCVIADLRLIFHDIPAFRPLLWLGCLMLLIFFLLDRHTKILSERNPRLAETLPALQKLRIFTDKYQTPICSFLLGVSILIALIRDNIAN